MPTKSVAPPSTRVQIQVRIPRELRDRLQAEAERRAISVNLLAERLLEVGLDRVEKQKALV